MNRPDIRRKLNKLGYRSARFSTQSQTYSTILLVVPKDENEQRDGYTNITIHNFCGKYGVHNNVDWIASDIKTIDAAVDALIEYLKNKNVKKYVKTNQFTGARIAWKAVCKGERSIEGGNFPMTREEEDTFTDMIGREVKSTRDVANHYTIEG